MNRGKKIVMILITFICIFVGFFFPKQLSSYQDQQLKNQIKSYDMEKVEIQNTSNLQSVLDIISGEYSIVNLEVGNTKYSKKQIYKKMKKLFTSSDKSIFGSLKNKQIINHSELPFLAVSLKESDSTTSATIIWSVKIFDSEKNMYNLLVDDLTGKMISADISFSEIYENKMANSGQKQAKEFYEVIKDYYSGYEISYNLVSDSSNIAATDSYDGNFTAPEISYYFRFLKNNKKMNQAKIEFNDNYFFFNFISK